jgi:superoxide dismutase
MATEPGKAKCIPILALCLWEHSYWEEHDG